MEITDETRDFLRFREKGDPEALARVFDALAPRLLLVAGHLSRDWSRAEDLVQETFLEAMRHADRFDAARPLAPWLTGILARRAADLRRREGRRLEAESRLAPDRGPEPTRPEDAAEAEEVLSTVTGAVEGLEEPYRGVLLLRLLHGLEPAQIAHALDRSPGAVRMQLKRGRDQLRRRLPASFAPALVVFDPGRGLGALRTAVLERAASVAAPAASGGASIAVTPVIVATVVGALAIVVGVALTLGGDGTPAAQDAVARIETAAAAEVAPGEPPPTVAVVELAREAADGERSAVQAVTGGALLVRVRREPTGEPVQGAGVYARPLGRAGLGREALTDAAGEARFEGLERGEYAVHLDRGGLEGRVSVAGDALLDLALPAGVRVAGRVVDREGRPVAGAVVHRLNPAHHEFLQRVARTDEDGRFELADVAPGTDLVARAEGWQLSETGRRGRVDGSPGEEVAVQLQLGSRGYRLAGRVVDEQDTPVPFALVGIAVDEDARELDDHEPPRERRRGGKPADLEASFVRADEQGRFESREVPRGRATLLARPLDPAAEEIAYLVLDVVDDATPQVELRLRRAATVAGRVLDEAGNAPQAMMVEAEWEGTQELGQVEDELGPFGFDVRVETDADGRFQLAGLLPGDYDLRVRAASGVELVRAELELVAGESATWNPVVPVGIDQAVRLLGPEGEPLEGWLIVATPEGNYPRARDAGRTDSAGRAVVQRMGLDVHALTMHRPSSNAEDVGLPAARREGVLAAGRELLLQLSSDEVRTAELAGVWTDASGVPLARASFRYELEGWPWAHPAETDDDGRFRLEPLPAGVLTLRSRHPRYPMGTELGAWTLAPGERRDVGRVSLSDPVPVLLRARVPAGVAGRPGEVQTGPRTTRDRLHVQVSNDHGRFLIDNREDVVMGSDGAVSRELLLVPGRYRAALVFHPASGLERPKAEVELDVRPGMAPVEVALE